MAPASHRPGNLPPVTDGTSPGAVPPPARHRILEATYRCIARSGLARVTVEDAAREAGVSRATVYRHFPGGRDELVRETVGHEVAHFFLDLADAVASSQSFVEVLTQALLHAHAAVADHEVLQELLVTEPDRLLPNLTVEANRLLPPIARFLLPHLAAEDLRPGIEVEAAAEYVARMVLSLVGAPGGWDLTDRLEVEELVCSQVLAGIVDGGVLPGGAAVPGEGAPAGPRATAPARAEGVERRILDAAVRCVARWGITKTTLDDIAREAGVSRATAYRAYPGGKETVVDAMVCDELDGFTTALDARLARAADLEDVLVAGITFASGTLTGHRALQYLLAHEPEQVLPHVSFGRFDEVLAAASRLAAPHLARFVGDQRASRTAEWITRLVLSYTLAPSPSYDLTATDDVRRLVRAHLLPGLAAAVPAAPSG